MANALSARLRAALEKLRGECDYEDHDSGDTNNFICVSALAPGVGKKTLADLLALRLIESGQNRYYPEIGYRITAAGRSAID